MLKNKREKPAFRLGIDVGGTNTDAALMQGNSVVATNKSTTTDDIGSGVVEAISSILEKANIRPSEITNLMIGTTQFINAFIQRKHLSKTAIIRIGLPKSDGVPPTVGWPDDILEAIGHHIYMVGGGSFYNGVEYAALDIGELEKIAKDIGLKGIKSVAICSVFAPVRTDIEERAAEIIKKHNPTVYVAKSADIGGVGLIERENATIVNASLVPFAERVVESIQQASRSVGVNIKPLFSQNDGTLINEEYVRAFPIITCSAGPTNSIRGAGFLTKEKDAVVVDVGGTTTDIGFLKNGFPRETSSESYVGGVRTNFRMPDVLSIGLGGGTVIDLIDGCLKIGPGSVGNHLQVKAKVFGGDTLTATDFAVAGGKIAIGDPSLASHLDTKLIERVDDEIHKMIEDAIDQMRTSAQGVHVIMVGGGSILVDRDLKGAVKTHRPEHAGVANAIGAAIGQVGGRIDKLFDFADGGREEALERAKKAAVQKAVQAGADPKTIELIEIEELPMTHMQTSAVRVKVNVVGDLA